METLFSVRDVARLFDLKESRLRYWAQTGFINPTGQQAGRRVYTFSDLIEVKAARELLGAGIPLQRVRKNLSALREALPGEKKPLRRLRVRSDGDHLVITENQATFSPVSGQLLLDFVVGDLGRQAADILSLDVSPGGDRRQNNPIVTTGSEGDPAEADVSSAYGWFLRGCACDGDPDRFDEAVDAYNRAIVLDPSLAAAHTNLGNLHYCHGDGKRAAQCYENACGLDPEQAEARYNLANIYEEEGDLDMAIAEYRRALRTEPDFADAHFNLALTLEKVGGKSQAVAHWRRYLELTGEEEKPWREVAQERLQEQD